MYCIIILYKIIDNKHPETNLKCVFESILCEPKMSCNEPYLCFSHMLHNVFFLGFPCPITHSLYCIFPYAALDIEIHCRKSENIKLLKDIDELRATLLSVMSSR